MFSDLGRKRKFGHHIVKRLPRILLLSCEPPWQVMERPIYLPERRKKKSRRIRVEPCGFESSRWHFMGTQPHATL